MSNYSVHEIQCEKCNKQFNAEVADSLNMSLDKESLNKIRNWDIMGVECPHCGHKMFYNHPILYNDSENNFMVQYAPDTKTFHEFIKTSDEMMKRFENSSFKFPKCRVVLGDYRCFVEKVEILTAGFNDMVVETYKELFYENVELEDVEMIIFEFSQSFKEKRLVVFFTDPNKDKEYYIIDDNVYFNIEEKLKKEPFFDRPNDYVVDRNFVQKITDEDSSKEPVHIEMVDEFIKQELELYHQEALELAKEGKNQEALDLLLPFAEGGFKDVYNDVGVLYERLKDYESAAKWYKASSCNTALKNLLTLYDNNRCDFDVKDYLKACQILIKRKNQYGYLYLSYIYQIDSKGIQNHKKAFDLLLKGLIYCAEKERLVFELGYLLEKGIGCEVDNYRSHKCYEALLDSNEEVVNYNYALQCYQGRGCEKNVELAIKHFEIAGEQNYQDAIKYLIKIYSSEEYKNDEKLVYYQKKKVN